MENSSDEELRKKESKKQRKRERRAGRRAAREAAENDNPERNVTAETSGHHIKEEAIEIKMEVIESD